MNRNIGILGILMLLMIFSINGVLGQIRVSEPADCEEGRQLCGTDNQGNQIVQECRNNEFVTIETCSENEICDVNSNGDLYCNNRYKEVVYGEIENNSFIGSLSTNHLLVGVIILLIIILIVLVWRIKKR
jgi:hypothetical protein